VYKDTLRSINVICFSVCILCIVTGVALSIIFIWGDVNSWIAGKTLLSIGILFLGSTMALFVNRIVGKKIVIGNSRYALDDDV